VWHFLRRFKKPLVKPDQSYKAYLNTNSQRWRVPGLPTAFHGPMILFQATGPSSISRQSRYILAGVCWLMSRGLNCMFTENQWQKKTAFAVVHFPRFLVLMLLFYQLINNLKWWIDSGCTTNSFWPMTSKALCVLMCVCECFPKKETCYYRTWSIQSLVLNENVFIFVFRAHGDSHVIEVGLRTLRSASSRTCNYQATKAQALLTAAAHWDSIYSSFFHWKLQKVRKRQMCMHTQQATWFWLEGKNLFGIAKRRVCSHKKNDDSLEMKRVERGWVCIHAVTRGVMKDCLTGGCKRCYSLVRRTFSIGIIRHPNIMRTAIPHKVTTMVWQMRWLFLHQIRCFLAYITIALTHLETLVLHCPLL